MSLAVRAIFAWCLAAAAVGAWAQLPTLTPPAGQKANVPVALANPRSTVRTFLEAMNEDRATDAVQTLDLSSINLVLRDTEGVRTARMLLDVLNRTIYINIEAIPDSPDGDTWTVVRPKSSDGRVLGAIEVERSSSGAWLFSNSTVEALPRIWETVRDRPVITGLKEVDARSIAPGQWMRAQVPEGWRGKSLWLEYWQWMFLGALALTTLLLHVFARVLIAVVLRLRSRMGSSTTTDATRRGLRRSVGWILAATLAVKSLPYLDLPELLDAPFMFFARFMQFATAVWMLFAIWDAVMEAVAYRATRFMQRADTILMPIASKLGKFVIFACCAVLFAATLGVNLAGLLAGLGIGGLVLALAAKDSVENVFGSLTILFDMPFGIGDWVRIGTIDGTVEEINLRSTRVRTFEDSVITVPNSTMIKASVENMGARRYRRLRVPLSLTYDTPADKVEEFCVGVRDMIAKHPHTRKDKYHVELNQLSESSLDVLLYLFFEVDNLGEELAMRSAFLLDVKRFAESIGVQFAFPSRTLYMQPPGEAGPPSASEAVPVGD